MRDGGVGRVGHFREFAGSLGQLKLRAKDETLEAVRDEVWARLAEQEERERDPEYVYALAAFADEVFLTLDWPFRQEWRARLLETRKFGSRAAGERVFAHIDELIESDAATRVPMAAVYLLMLGLGFRGRFRSAGHRPQIEQRRAGLWAMIERHQRGVFGREILGGAPQIAPQAYGHTLQDGALLRLASPARWWAASALVALAWLAGSTYTWLKLAEPVNLQIENVERKLAGPRAQAEGRLR